MTLILKRKRRSVKVVEVPKREKSVQKAQDCTNFSKFEYSDAPSETHEANGIDCPHDSGKCFSKFPEAELFIEKGLLPQTQNKTTPSLEWQVSAPIGGRMIDVDPIYTKDEKFLIIAHRKSIKVYSTSNSLLNLDINLHNNSARGQQVRIVAYSLSPTDSNLLWVAFSDGEIYRINWTTGEGWKRSWSTSTDFITQMTVSSMDLDGHKRDIVFTAEGKGVGWQISAHDLGFLGNSFTTTSRIIYPSRQPIQILKAAVEGDIILAASEERILIGKLRSRTFGSVEKIRYDFHVFESKDYILSMDFRVSDKTLALSSNVSKVDKASIVDVVVGDVKGAIFVHTDLLSNLLRFQSRAEGETKISLVPRKFHWHRTGVLAVKWSLDGNYIISGGNETVMILWQLDTSRQQFLPHLAAAIQNIVISPRGISYAVHLADNSVMILSTSELVPTTNVAGIQARVLITHTALNAHVPRVEDEKLQRLLIPRTPALINPRDPSRLLLAVGEVQEIPPQFVTALSTPFLQTFNVAYNHNISRQALSRTNITNKIMGPNAHRVCTATVTHMQISYDGMWLVTVDDWLPPKRDVEFLGHGGMNLEDERRLRREVYLKFWQWNKSNESWELVTRIDSPHTMAGESYGAGRVLSLAANSNSLTFSTLGEDAVVQMWRPRSRKRDGTIIRGADCESLYIWSCQRRLYIGNAEIGDDKLPGTQIPEHACLTFSEDGSVLAAAISRWNGVIHLIDPFTGTIRASRPNMYRGELISIAFLAQYLIVLSDNLQVYDLVLNERKFIVPLGDIKVILSLDQKVEMIHLAVDRSSRTFAVGLPCKETRVVKERKSFVSLSVADTAVTVYQPEHFQPLYTYVFPSLATALLPAISSPGYIILDSTAEITTISPKASQTLTSMAKPMVDLRLDIRNEERPAIDLLELAASAEDIENIQTDSPIDLPAATGPDTAEDDVPMVSQHQLSSIFDVGPSFTLPPIEELFYQVAGLFSTKSTEANVS